MANEFIARKGIISLGDVTVTGSITATGGITISGSITSASYAVNTSYLNNSGSGEFVPTGSFNTFSSSILTYTGSANSRFSSIESTTGSLNTASGSAITRLSSLESKTGSYATTGSNTFIGNQTITGSILGSGSLTINGCITATGQIVAQTINVQQVTSSIVYSCGSNILGTSTSNTQTLCGNVFNTGSVACFSNAVCSNTVSTTDGTNVSTLANNYLRYNGGDFYVDACAVGGNFRIRTSNTTALDSTALFICGKNSNVGIGTTTPSYKLDVNGSFSFTTGGNYLQYSSGILYHGNYYQYPSGNDYLLFARTSGGLNFGTNDTQRLSISSTGIASFTCQICTVAAVTADLRYTGTGYITYDTSVSGTANLIIRQDANERVRITNGGCVGIANSSPSSFLHLGTYASSGKYIDSATLPTAPSNYLITLTPPSTTNYYGGGIAWSEGTCVAAAINAYDDGATGALGLSISTGTNNGLSERVRITSTGIACFACQVCAPTLISSGGISATGVICSTSNIQSNSQIYALACPPANNGGIFNARDCNANGANTSFAGIFFNSSPGSDYSIGKLTVNTVGYLQVRNGNNGCSFLIFDSAGIACFACQICTPMLLASGCIGINVTSPGQTLHVYNGGGALGYKTARFDSNDIANGTRLLITNTGNTSCRGYALVTGGCGGTGPGADNFSIGYYASDSTFITQNMFVLTSTGCVGVGTTSPTEKFVVSETTCPSQITLKQETNFNLGIIGQLNYIGGGIGSKSAMIESNRVGGSATNAYRGGDLRFYTKVDDTFDCLVERMRITNGGNVGIGTTSTSTEANLFLGAQGTIEGGQLVLQKGTSCSCATHLDNYQDSFRVLVGSNTTSTGVHMVIDHKTANACLYGTLQVPIVYNCASRWQLAGSVEGGNNACALVVDTNGTRAVRVRGIVGGISGQTMTSMGMYEAILYRIGGSGGNESKRFAVLVDCNASPGNGQGIQMNVINDNLYIQNKTGMSYAQTIYVWAEPFFG